MEKKIMQFWRDSEAAGPGGNGQGHWRKKKDDPVEVWTFSTL